MPIAGNFTVVGRPTKEWQDLDCGSMSLVQGKCHLCAPPGQRLSIPDVAVLCLKNPDCAVFILDEVAQCAHLKTNETLDAYPDGRAVAKENTNLRYCLNDRGADCNTKGVCGLRWAAGQSSLLLRCSIVSCGPRLPSQPGKPATFHGVHCAHDLCI